MFTYINSREALTYSTRTEFKVQCTYFATKYDSLPIKVSVSLDLQWLPHR